MRKGKKLFKKFMLLSVIMVVVTTGQISYEHKPGSEDNVYELYEEAISNGTLSESAIVTGVIEGNGFSQSIVVQMVNDGYFRGYVDRLKSEGWLPSDYTIPGSSSAPTPTPEPTQPPANTADTSNSQNTNESNNNNTSAEVNKPKPTEKPVTEDESVAGDYVVIKDADIWKDSQKSESIGNMTAGEAVVITAETSNGYYRITYNEENAYINKKDVVTKEEWEAGWEESERVEPTCTESGSVTYINVVNGTTMKTEELAALEHSYEITETAEPTCTEAGHTTYTCPRCGDSYTEETDALGHTEGEWIVTKEAGLFSTGTKTLSCVVCGEVLETAEISQTCPLSLTVVVGICTGVVAVIAGVVVVVVKKKKHFK